MDNEEEPKNRNFNDNSKAMEKCDFFFFFIISFDVPISLNLNSSYPRRFLFLHSTKCKKILFARNRNAKYFRKEKTFENKYVALEKHQQPLPEHATTRCKFKHYFSFFYPLHNLTEKNIFRKSLSNEKYVVFLIHLFDSYKIIIFVTMEVCTFCFNLIKLNEMSKLETENVSLLLV